LDEETVDIRFYPFAKDILMRRYTVKILSPFCSLACFLALAGALSGCATESGGESMTDDKITANVQAMINKHSDVGPPDSIHVETRDHVVYLSGLVSTGLMKSTAEDLAQHSRGVTKVVSDIAVTK
jgi:hypothetical protein